MELVLNLVWALLAIGMVAIWWRLESRRGSAGTPRVVALAVLLLILFPVISVSDDFWAAQNPAEADSYTRRDHTFDRAHSILPDFGFAPNLPRCESPFVPLGPAVEGASGPAWPTPPDLASPFIRPPPAA